jgi:ABC-type uncharacterized transport system permease subunit
MNAASWISALVAMGGLATAGSAAVGGLRRASPDNWCWWHPAAGVAGLVNIALLVGRAVDVGPEAWLRTSFDVTVLLATMVLAVGLLCATVRSLRGLDGFLIPLAAVIQAVAFLALLRQGDPPLQQAPAWFVVHMVTLVLGTTCFLSGGAAGLVFWATHRALRSKRKSGLVGHVPPLESLERFSRWMVTAGLPLFTLGILTGICEMVQAEEPSAWLWDQVVILSFLLWAAYAATVLLIWLRPQHRGRRAAALSASGVVVLLIVFLVLVLFPAAHR